MKRKLKRLLSVFLAGLLLLGVTGCSGGSGTGKEGIRLMVWSPSEDQSKDNGAWLQTCCEQFAALHPEWDITFVYGVAPEDKAADSVSQDPEDSADVFLYSNDNIMKLTDAKALAKIGGKYADEVTASISEALVDSVTLDGYLYGIPFTTNTWFMYYDKRVFSEEDIKSLEAMLEKGVVSLRLTSSWYFASFYYANGCTLFGDGTQEELGADFGGENGVEVTNYLIDLLKNPNFVIDESGSGMAGLRDGSVNALFSGSWSYDSIKEVLGENLGAAALPTIEINGEAKQMYAFAGSKAIGVNAHSENMVAAVELAIYLGSAEAQRLHYELRSVIPCNIELLNDPKIMADPVVAAQSDTFERTSVLQPFVASVANCWTPMQNMGKSIRDGSTTHDNAAAQTKAMNDAMNSSGIS